MTHTIVAATIRHGYTGYDHLIDSDDIDTVRSFIGRSYKTYAAAQRAVEKAYVAGCDPRVELARVDVTCHGPRGYVGPQAAEFKLRDDKAIATAAYAKRLWELGL